MLHKLSNTYWNTLSVRSALFVYLILAILVSACGGGAIAPAPVDGDVVNLLSGTTNWIINQAAKNVPAAGTEVLYNAQKGLVVIGTPFQEGYGFTVLDSNTLDAIDDPQVAQQLTGNYVNWKTWEGFKEFLLQNGWVSQLLVMWSTVANSWFTFVVGIQFIPSEITIDGLPVPPGIDPEGFVEYKQ